MTEEEQTLWDDIQNFPIDDPEVEFSFTDRLARENGWSLIFSLRAVQEYKKFLFLICTSNQPLTPSDEVDQVWHLHLLYTQSYWKELCQNTLGREIHHGPTKGGTSEKTKYNNLYESTKELYQLKFGTPPPSDLWPPSHIRFGNIRFTRVNRHQYWIMPKFNIFKKWKT